MGNIQIGGAPEPAIALIAAVAGFLVLCLMGGSAPETAVTGLLVRVDEDVVIDNALIHGFPEEVPDAAFRAAAYIAVVVPADGLCLGKDTIALGYVKHPNGVAELAYTTFIGIPGSDHRGEVVDLCNGHGAVGSSDGAPGRTGVVGEADGTAGKPGHIAAGNVDAFFKGIEDHLAVMNTCICLHRVVSTLVAEGELLAAGDTGLELLQNLTGIFPVIDFPEDATEVTE